MDPHRLWPAIVLRFPPSAPVGEGPFADLVAAALDGWHPSAIEELEDGWRVFFAAPDERDRAAAALVATAPEGIAITAVDVADEDWARRSQAGLLPVRVGRVVIAPPRAEAPCTTSQAVSDPPGESPESQPGPSVRILIQPSMGFGTGHHASTRLCAALLQRIAIAGRQVLDVGTGSGVLALVSAALGAASVVAIDNDPDAIESARENLALNGVGTGIELRLASIADLSGLRADIVTANLTGALLVRSVDRLVQALAAGGALIVSGVTLDEEPEVVAAFERCLRLAGRAVEDDWVGLWLEHPPMGAG